MQSDPEYIELLNKSIIYRGKILHECTMMEGLMDSFLSTFFCKEERRSDFYELVLGNNRMSLDAKRKLIDNIIKRHEINIKTTLPDYATHMNIAMKERNIFAHNAVFPIPNNENATGFIRYGLNPDVHYYSEKKVDEIITSIKKCANLFWELQVLGHASNLKDDR